MKHLVNFWNGVVSVFDLSIGNYQVSHRRSHRGFILPKKGEGFAQDARNLAGDWRKVGNDIQRATSKVKEQYWIQ